MFQRLFAREDARVPKAVLSGQQFIELKAEALKGRFPPIVVRHDKGQIPHQMRRVLQKEPALLERFHHQPDVALLQVAHSAMRQLRAAAGSTLAEIALLDQQHFVSARRRIDCHPEAAPIDKESDADRETEEANLPQVAPGLHLPELSGMFLLDNFKGQPQLVELQQGEGDINRNTKGNILRGVVASGKATIELDGEHASTYAHVAVPSIYIRMDDDLPAPAPPPGQTASAKPSLPSLDAPRAEPQRPEQPQQPEQAIVPFDRFRIVHLKVKGGKRIVGDLKRNPTGKISQDQNSVKTTIDHVAAGWLKLTPTEDLAPGEYAIVEMKGTAGMNLYIWPFSVNPTAPANANPWTPDVKDKNAESAKPKGI